MDISKTMQDAINAQIQAEYYSSYLYLAMSAYCEEVNMPGYAHWMRTQAREEMEHTMKFYRYVVERGGRVVFGAIEQPPVEFESVLAVAEETQTHEQKVTSLIHKLYEVAVEEKDYATHNFLQWYVAEQIEEEALARTILDKINLIGDDKGGLYLFDNDVKLLVTNEEPA